MLHTDEAGVVPQSPEDLREMVGVIMVVCAVFGLIVSEAKTETICLRTKGVPEATAIFGVEAAGLGVQPNEIVRIPRGERQPHRRSLHRGRPGRIRNTRCSFRRYILELHDQPSAPLEFKIWMLSAEVLEIRPASCVTWSPRACHYRTLRRVHLSVRDPCIVSCCCCCCCC